MKSGALSYILLQFTFLLRYVQHLRRRLHGQRCKIHLPQHDLRKTESHLKRIETTEKLPTSRQSRQYDTTGFHTKDAADSVDRETYWKRKATSS